MGEDENRRQSVDPRKALLIVVAIVTLVIVGLAAAVTVVFLGSREGAGAAVNPLLVIGAITGFVGLSINQFMTMLRGQWGDQSATKERRETRDELKVNTEVTQQAADKADVAAVKAGDAAVAAQTIAHRINGDLDERIADAVKQATESQLTALATAMKDVQAEEHQIKHDMKNMVFKHELIAALVEIAAGHKVAHHPLAESREGTSGPPRAGGTH